MLTPCRWHDEVTMVACYSSFGMRFPERLTEVGASVKGFSKLRQAGLSSDSQGALSRRSAFCPRSAMSAALGPDIFRFRSSASGEPE